MSFFRVLLALIISGGIAYGLYVAVDGKGFDDVVEAVRTEIVDPVRARLDPEATTGENAVAAATGDGAAEDRTAPEAAAIAALDEADAEASNASVAAVDTEAEAGAGETAPAAGEESATTENAAADTAENGDSGTILETVQENVQTFVEEAGDTITTAAQSAVETTQSALTTAAQTTVETTQNALAGLTGSDEAEETSENGLPRIAAMPAPSDAVMPTEGQAPAALEAQATLPAARIEASAVDTASTDVLGVVSGGMAYAQARETMVAAGWEPRVPEYRVDAVSVAENTLIEAGYPELEGCNDAERPLCRFEFVDGQKRIAAVLTAGAGTDPSVIDAFLMDIRAE